MKLHNAMKKLSAIIMVFAMIFSVFAVSPTTVVVKAANSPVKMYCCDMEGSYRGSIQYSVYIQVDASSAANKAVYVHHRTYAGSWEDTAATYVTKLDANTEIWKATIFGTNVGQYSIKYVGDGQTYWDNNNGDNYSCYDVFGQANVRAARSYSQIPSSYNIRVNVKNLAYAKVVKVRYTQDNWATYQDVNLSYQYTRTDTDIDTEVWSVALNLDADKMDSFHYCISYEVNGQTYWDNNFGANFDKNFYMIF